MSSSIDDIDQDLDDLDGSDGKAADASAVVIDPRGQLRSTYASRHRQLFWHRPQLLLLPGPMASAEGH